MSDPIYEKTVADAYHELLDALEGFQGSLFTEPTLLRRTRLKRLLEAYNAYISIISPREPVLAQAVSKEKEALESRYQLS